MHQQPLLRHLAWKSRKIWPNWGSSQIWIPSRKRTFTYPTNGWEPKIIIVDSKVPFTGGGYDYFLFPTGVGNCFLQGRFSRRGLTKLRLKHAFLTDICQLSFVSQFAMAVGGSCFDSCQTALCLMDISNLRCVRDWSKWQWIIQV